MREYDICSTYDEDVFGRQCTALENHIDGLKKEALLIDVDGTQIQRYMLAGQELMVYNDAQLGVIIKSQFDIDPFFEKH